MTRIITISVPPLLCFLFSLLSIQTISQLHHRSTFCNPYEFTRTSSYGSNRDSVLSTLRDRSNHGSYSNVTSGLSPNTVYGMFLCRGDTNKTFCSDCVHTATLEIPTSCMNQKEVFVYYDECMVRYSDFNFSTLVENTPAFSKFPVIGSWDSSQFYNHTLAAKIDDLIVRSSARSPFPYFVDNEERVTQLEGWYDLETMVQCSPDLSPENCTVCLRLAVQQSFECCNYSQARWAKIFYPKCQVTYNISALSLGVTNGNQIFWRIFFAIMTTSVLALMCLS